MNWIANTMENYVQGPRPTKRVLVFHSFHVHWTNRFNHCRHRPNILRGRKCFPQHLVLPRNAHSFHYGLCAPFARYRS